jgi:DUF4097 and DUF4098 domain-containing protein YvlB
MSERTERFEISGTPRLVLRLPAGEVRVVPGAPGEVVVRARAGESDLNRLVIAAQAGTVTVEVERSGWGRWAAVDVEIAVGAPPEVRARLASGGLLLRTAVAEVDVSSASGGVEAGAVAGRLIARLASGDLHADEAGTIDIVSASGDVRVSRVGGDAAVKTASGDVTLGSVGGDAAVRTASGDLAISRLEGSRLDAKTVSGDVRVGVVAGRRYSILLQSLSGDVRSDFPCCRDGGGPSGRLQVGTVSGDIRIAAAPAG